MKVFVCKILYDFVYLDFILTTFGLFSPSLLGSTANCFRVCRIKWFYDPELTFEFYCSRIPLINFWLSFFIFISNLAYFIRLLWIWHWVSPNVDLAVMIWLYACFYSFCYEFLSDNEFCGSSFSLRSFPRLAN